jgi:hypothetical protein
MTQIARRSLAVVAGMAATVGAATFGLCLLSERLHTMRPTSSSADDDGSRPPTRIIWTPVGLRYFEGDNELRLSLEPTPRYDIVYVPTARRWPAKMPEWARRRRDDIMADIKRLAVGYAILWVDDDT